MHFHYDFSGHGHRGPRGPWGGRHGFMGRFGGGSMGGRAGFRAARMLASGDLQLIVLALLEEKPRHGYELIKALEDHSSGIYVPSPGVIYPALTYLEEVGYAEAEAEGNKKRYKITPGGAEHLAKNRKEADETLAHLARFGSKMAQMQKQFAEDEADEEFADARTENKREWRQLKMEFHELKDELRSALREKMHATAEEKERVFAILRRAIQEIRGK